MINPASNNSFTSPARTANQLIAGPGSPIDSRNIDDPFYNPHGGNGNTLNLETYLFRDPTIRNLAGFISDRFPHGVPIILYASSYGHEPYSLAMKLSDVVGYDKARERYPIKARDICSDVVEKCRKGTIILPDHYEEGFDFYTSFGFKNAFTNGEIVADREKQYCVTDRLKQMVDFGYGDVVDEARQGFNFKLPVVFMFRHAWYHLDIDTAEELASNLFKELPSGSIIVNGGNEFSTVNNRSEAPQSFRAKTVIEIQKDAGFRIIEGADQILHPAALTQQGFVLERP